MDQDGKNVYQPKQDVYQSQQDVYCPHLQASFGAINSETLLGRFIKERKEKDPGVEVAVLQPNLQLNLPWRLGRQGVITALRDSLYRLGLQKRLREAREKLQKRGIPLASDQVNYSLIYRAPEEKGVKATNDELGITLVAYSPIAQGSPELVDSPRQRCADPRSQKCRTGCRICGALGWRLNNEEVAELRSLATEIRFVTGFPVENL